MALDLKSITDNMSTAFVGVLEKYAEDINAYAQSEAQKFAASLTLIETESLAGTISPEEAKLHLDLQAHASRAVFLAIEGVGLIAAESAINAGLSVIKDAVNAALGFKLIL